MAIEGSSGSGVVDRAHFATGFLGHRAVEHAGSERGTRFFGLGREVILREALCILDAANDVKLHRSVAF